MSSNLKNILIIDCGASHVSASFFARKGKKIVLEHYLTEAIGSDFGSDEEWVASVSMALGNLSKKKKLGGNAIVILPGHLLLSKFLKVPHVAKSKRDQIVRFEAQQNIPYPLKEVAWDYHVVADDGVEFDVALAAAKVDIVDRLCSEVNRHGMRVELVEPSCMAQYNAFYHTHSGDEHNALILNIGAKSSNLLFINEGNFFVRNVPLAGGSLTQAIAEELDMSQEEAEMCKLDYVRGSDLGDFIKGAVGRHVDAFQKKVVVEMTRSIVNFRRQSGAENISRVFLTGGGSLLPQLAEQVEEKLKTPVEVYDPTSGFSLASSVDADLIAERQYELGEPLGAALRVLGQSKAHFNLLPPAIIAQREFATRKPLLAAAAVVFIGAAFIPIYNAHSTAEIYERTMRDLESEMVPVRRVDTQIQENIRLIEEARAEMDAMRGLVESKSNWINLFGDLQERLVSVGDVWLESLQVLRDGETAAGAAGGAGFNPYGGGGFGMMDDAEAEDDGALRISISGRMLDQSNPGRPVSDNTRARVSRLIESFVQSEFIASKDDGNFDTSEPGVLRFDFTLVVDPDRPL